MTEAISDRCVQSVKECTGHTKKACTMAAVLYLSHVEKSASGICVSNSKQHDSWFLLNKPCSCSGLRCLARFCYESKPKENRFSKCCFLLLAFVVAVIYNCTHQAFRFDDMHRVNYCFSYTCPWLWKYQRTQFTKTCFSVEACESNRSRSSVYMQGSRCTSSCLSLSLFQSSRDEWKKALSDS